MSLKFSLLEFLTQTSSHIFILLIREGQIMFKNFQPRTISDSSSSTDSTLSIADGQGSRKNFFENKILTSYFKVPLKNIVFYMKSKKPYDRFSEVFNNEEESSDEFTSEDSSSTQDSPQSTSHVTDTSFTTEGFKIISDTVKC